MRANEIAIKTATTGKVTVVVAVMSISSKKGCNLQSANSGNESLLAKRRKVLISLKRIPTD
jgi:hypothetical protein